MGRKSLTQWWGSKEPQTAQWNARIKAVCGCTLRWAGMVRDGYSAKPGHWLGAPKEYVLIPNRVDPKDLRLGLVSYLHPSRQVLS